MGASRYPMNNGPSSTSIIASVDDLIKWYLDLFSNHGTTSKVLSENSINQIIKPWNLEVPSLGVYYGQGVTVTYPNGTNSSEWPAQIGHNGISSYCSHSAIYIQVLNESSTVAAALDSNCIIYLDSKQNYEDLKKMNASFQSVIELFRLPDEFQFIPDYITSELLKIWSSA